MCNKITADYINSLECEDLVLHISRFNTLIPDKNVYNKIAADYPLNVRNLQYQVTSVSNGIELPVHIGFSKLSRWGFDGVSEQRPACYTLEDVLLTPSPRRHGLLVTPTEKVVTWITDLLMHQSQTNSLRVQQVSD